jgi:predicted P-loop ATPase/GTPase
MKQILISIFFLVACNVFAQQDTVLNVNVTYAYERFGSSHFYVTTTVNPDSSVTVQRSAPFKTKKEVVDFAKKQIEDSDKILDQIKEELQRKQEYLQNLQEQAVQFAQSMNQEINKVRNEIIGLRTQRKLAVDSKQLLKNVK